MAKLQRKGTGQIIDVPDEAVDFFPDYEPVTDEDIAETHDPDPQEVAAQIPPRGGAGSGIEDWAAYATSNGVDVIGLERREDIIAALEEAGVATE